MAYEANLLVMEQFIESEEAEIDAAFAAGAGIKDDDSYGAD